MIKLAGEKHRRLWSSRFSNLTDWYHTRTENNVLKRLDYPCLFEAFADSQFHDKYIGGYSTALAHKIKTTVNGGAQTKAIPEECLRLVMRCVKLAKSRPDLYTRKNRQAIDTDVMVVTTALSAD